ncbi:MAG: outer membrane beta-barrel protein [Bacteroidales bacterium]
MKKIFFILLCVLCITDILSAQNIKFGPKISGVISNLGVYYYKKTNNPGVSAGVFLEYGKSHWAGSADLMILFSEQPYGGAIILPLSVKYYVGKRFYVKAGPSFGAKLFDMDSKPFPDENRKRLFVGFNCGIGVKIAKKFYLDLGYDRSLTNRSYTYSVMGLSFSWNVLKAK